MEIDGADGNRIMLLLLFSERSGGIKHLIWCDNESLIDFHL